MPDEIFEERWTPGPWDYHDDDHYGNLGYRAFGVYKRYTDPERELDLAILPLATLGQAVRGIENLWKLKHCEPTPSDAVIAEARANACLMAAAPDMVKLLTRASRVIEELLDELPLSYDAYEQSAVTRADIDSLIHRLKGRDV